MKGANWDWWRELSNCSEDLPLSEGEREGKEGGREEGFQTRIHFYKNSSKAFREYSSQSFPSRNPKSASVSLPHWDIEGNQSQCRHTDAFPNAAARVPSRFHALQHEIPEARSRSYHNFHSAFIVLSLYDIIFSIYLFIIVPKLKRKLYANRDVPDLFRAVSSAPRTLSGK